MHQFPKGVVLSMARRLELLAWARERGAWVVEDDYASEFRYRGRPLASLQDLDEAERVIYIGTLNKALFPGLSDVTLDWAAREYGVIVRAMSRLYIEAPARSALMLGFSGYPRQVIAPAIARPAQAFER